MWSCICLSIKRKKMWCDYFIHVTCWLKLLEMKISLIGKSYVPSPVCLWSCLSGVSQFKAFLLSILQQNNFLKCWLRYSYESWFVSLLQWGTILPLAFQWSGIACVMKDNVFCSRLIHRYRSEKNWHIYTLNLKNVTRSSNKL